MNGKGSKSYFALTKGRRRLPLTLALALGVIVAALGYLLYVSQISRASDQEENLALHIHVQLEIIADGRKVPIPAQIGIHPQLWQDHELDAHGSMNMSPLHTHDATGLIHVESRTLRDYTLGEFFRVWGQPFNAQCILNFCGDGGRRLTLLVNGLLSFDFEQLRLQDGMRLRIEFSG